MDMKFISYPHFLQSAEILKIVEKVVHSVEPNGRVECTQIYEDWIDLCISAPSVRAGIRQTLLIALGDALQLGDADHDVQPRQRHIHLMGHEGAPSCARPR